MDLFVVNRFMGDGSVDQVDEDANLSKLMASIEERKKRRALDREKKHLETSIAPESVPLARTSNDMEADAISVTNESVSTEQLKSKKKKKRKRKVSSSDEDEGVTGSLATDLKIVPGEGFTVLGTDHFSKGTKVKRVLPQWLAQPSVVSTDLQNLSTAIGEIPGIDIDMISNLRANGIRHFFPVQCQVIPWILSGIGKPSQFWPRDVCVSAPTGSGKTLAYIIPILQALKTRVVPRIRALVVLPVQDLAAQVARVFETYCVGSDLKVALATGNQSFVQEQKQLLRSSLNGGSESLVDILITTPGRIVDHLKLTPGFTLQHLQFLVIDEADRILENIKNEWLHHVNQHISSFSGSRHLTVAALQSLPRPPQKLLFSATLSHDPEKLTLLGLFQPKLFTTLNEGTEIISKYVVPAELHEQFCIVTQSNKPLVLYHLLVKEEKMKNVLCFTDTRVQSHRLALLLQKLGEGKFTVAEVSAALNRQQRDDILTKFSQKKIDIVVCTDTLARGMDLPHVDLVVSYNAPRFMQNYVHRIGRTARAGRPGTAITLVTKQQLSTFQAMLQRPITELLAADHEINELSSHFAAALEALRVNLQEEQESELEKRKSEKRNRKPNRKHKIKRKNSLSVESNH